MMTQGQAVQALDMIDRSDGDRAHGEADAILLAYIPPEVRAAYERVQRECPFWATA